MKKTVSDEVKTSLMNKYREMFIDKLTPQDLEELQFYLGHQYNEKLGWNSEYKLKFEFKLRQYFHEEILRRELASIETLLELMQPQDLKILALWGMQYSSPFSQSSTLTNTEFFFYLCGYSLDRF